MQSGIIYKRANTNEELKQILQLQKNNLPLTISEIEKKKEGFVTAQHDLKILNAMNNKCAHVIAKSNDRVVGYALCMLKEFKEDITVLRPMFKKIEDCLKNNETYIVMGQICIDKTFRKQGIFKKMYQYMRQQLQLDFDMIITEVDQKNIRSLNAHYAVGFKLLNSYNSNQQDWALISWDWS